MNRKQIRWARELQESGYSYDNIIKKLRRAYDLTEDEGDEVWEVARTPESEWPQDKPHNWRDDPATRRQISYIRGLGVSLSQQQASELTKGTASQIIDAVKRGDGVGTFNLFFNDGGN